LLREFYKRNPRAPRDQHLKLWEQRSGQRLSMEDISIYMYIFLLLLSLWRYEQSSAESSIIVFLWRYEQSSAESSIIVFLWRYGRYPFS
jgi:hypothetical protein